MRFVAKYAKYSITVQQQKQILTADGYAAIAQPDITANFQQGGMLPHEVDTALATFRFQGLPDGFDPTLRLSSFDTEHVYPNDPETRKYVEDKLLAAPERNSDFIHVETPRIARPWPNYDTVRHVAKIIDKVREDGYDLEQVIAYEEQNENRLNVIEALGKLRLEAANVAPDAEEILA